MSKLATPERIAMWRSWIGKKVWKREPHKNGDVTRRNAEPKPFKSGLKINTVKGVHKHPFTEHLAFTFEEDSSSVECFRCSLAPNQQGTE